MRLFEILFLLTLLALIVLPTRRVWIERRWLLFCLVCATAIFLGVHVWTEGQRWQMWPAYALFVCWSAVIFALAKRNGYMLHAAKVAAVVVLGLGAALAILLPVPVLPEPPGPYKIGTQIFHFTDTARDEPYTDDPNDKRELMVQVWYPSTGEGPNSEPEPWIRDAYVFGPAIARELHFPSFFMNYIGLVKSHAYLDAEPSNDKGGFPVVVYSHGWTGFRKVNVDQIEMLASYGYIVVAPDHTYGALATVFPKDKVILNKRSAMPEKDNPETYRTGINLLVNTYAGDIKFVIGQLKELNSGAVPSKLQGMIDLTRIGVFGHSTGGGAIVEVCATDPRVKAGLGLDPWVEPVPDDILSTPIPVPFMSIRSEAWFRRDGSNNGRLKALMEKAKSDKYDLYLQHSIHYDFTLTPILSPISTQLGIAGGLNGQRALSATGAYTKAFFDHYLQTPPAPLDVPLKDYPEVVVAR